MKQIDLPSICADLARKYAEFLGSKNDDSESIEEDLLKAQTIIASIGLVPEIQDYLELKDDTLSKEWLITYKNLIKGLSDEQQETYRVLRGWSKGPEDIELVKPNSWMVLTTVLENEVESLLPKFKALLMCDENDKLFPYYMNLWEVKVLETEMKRDDFLAWYRNPGYANQESLGISYLEDKSFQIVRLDILFFSENKDKSISVDIVDPHRYHLSDSLPKLKGLAEYAKTHKLLFRRIETIAKIEGRLKVLDLTDPKIRSAVYEAKSAKSLYESSLAQYY